MKREDALRLVRKEVESIIKVEGKEVPTPYVVLEVIRRAATWKPWDGLDASQTFGVALRGLVEEVMHGVTVKLVRGSGPEVWPDSHDGHPYRVLQQHGVPLHRHINPPRKAG